MFDDAYPLYAENRAVGQTASDLKGLSLKGRFKTDLSSDGNYFDNRAVGQTFVRYGNDEFFDRIVPTGYNNSGYGGWAPITEPMNNPVSPTTVYGADKLKILGMEIWALVAIAAGIAVIVYLIKTRSD